MIENDKVGDMVNQANLFDNVDLCLTCVSPKPPILPLREELTSLGIELIYNAKGVGKQTAFKEYEKQIQDRQSICYAFLSILPGAESHGFNNQKLSKQVAISYEKYLLELSLRRSHRQEFNMSKTLDSDDIDVECNQSRIVRRMRGGEGFEIMDDDNKSLDTLQEETKLITSTMDRSNGEKSSSSSDDENNREGNNIAQLHVALVCSMNPSMTDEEFDQYSHSFSSIDNTHLGISKNDQQYENYSQLLEDHQDNLNLLGFIPVQRNFKEFQVVVPGEDRQQQQQQQQQDIPKRVSKRSKLLGIKINSSDKKLLKKVLQRNKNNFEEEQKQEILLTPELTSSLSTQAHHFLQVLESDPNKNINDSPGVADEIQDIDKDEEHNLSRCSFMTCETKDDDTSGFEEVKKEDMLAADNEMVNRMIKFHDGQSLFKTNDEYQQSTQSSDIAEDDSKCEVSIKTTSMCEIDDVSSVDTLEREWKVNTSSGPTKYEKESFQEKSEQDDDVAENSPLPAELQMNQGSNENKIVEFESSHSCGLQKDDILTHHFESWCETKDTDDCDFEDDEEEEENLLGVILSGIRNNCSNMMCQPFSPTRKRGVKVPKSDSFVMSHTILETISEDETFSDDDLPMNVTTTQHHYKSRNLNVI